MTQVTPPGWYPDPGQKNDGPATERWWDGGAWTDRTRPAGSAAPWVPPVPPAAAGPYGTVVDGPGALAQPVPPSPPASQGHPGQPGQPGYGGPPACQGYPGYPGHPGAVPAPSRRGGARTWVAVGVAAAVLASIGVGVYALADDDAGPRRTDSRQGPGGGGTPFGDGDRDGGSPSPRQRGDGGGPGDSGGSGGSEGDGQRGRVSGGGTLSDVVNGITMPVPEGWSGQPNGAGAAMSSDTTYPCPATPSETCTKGGVYSAPARLLEARGATPEEIARNDIARNAEESYGTGYGKITSHQELAAEPVAVAGQKGYLVRWKAVTSKGSDGYVQSLAVPSPADPEHRMIIIRFGLDTDQKVSVLDDITRGIKKGSTGGAGRDV